MSSTDEIFAENRKHIGSVIKKNRKFHNIRQMALAEELGVTAATISRYESGEIDIPASSLEPISKKCKFNPKEYFHKDNPYELLESIAKGFYCTIIKEEPIMSYPKEIEVDTETLEALQDLDTIITASKRNPLLGNAITIDEDLVIEIINNDSRQTNHLLKYYSLLTDRLKQNND